MSCRHDGGALILEHSPLGVRVVVPDLVVRVSAAFLVDKRHGSGRREPRCTGPAEDLGEEDEKMKASKKLNPKVLDLVMRIRHKARGRVGGGGR